MTDPADPDPADSDPAVPDPAVLVSPAPEDVRAVRDARAAREARDAEAERKRRRDRVFGAVLADTTSDERGDRPADEGSRDAELRRNVPPHHG